MRGTKRHFNSSSTKREAIEFGEIINPCAPILAKEEKK